MLLVIGTLGTGEKEVLDIMDRHRPTDLLLSEDGLLKQTHMNPLKTVNHVVHGCSTVSLLSIMYSQNVKAITFNTVSFDLLKDFLLEKVSVNTSIFPQS